MPNTIMIALACIILLVMGQSFLKYGLVQVGGVNFTGGQIFVSVRRILSVPYIVLGFTLYGISSILWLDVLSRLDLSVAFPMVSLTYAFTMVTGAVFFDERVNLLRVTGVAIICLGVFLVGKSQ